jgi:tRNA(Ile)-lysidine synthase
MCPSSRAFSSRTGHSGPVLARVRRSILERGLLARGDRVLAACSGGPDSVALVHALHRIGPELGIEVSVASVDHGLRPEAADEVAWVGAFAEGLALPFRPLRVTVPPGPSLQAAARRVRYEALRGAAQALGARRIATGHTLDDQAETVLARLLRGAGVAGLSGISPKRRDGVVRPLLDCTRAEVRAHLAHHGLRWLEDPSNQDPRFERVRLRSQVLPMLAEEDPQVRVHLAQLADEARVTARWAQRRARRILARAAHPDRLRTARLRSLGPPVRRALLRQWVARATGADPGRAHLEALEHALRGRGEVWLPGGARVVASPGELRLLCPG